MIEFKNPTVTINGVEYEAELGRVEETMFGYEDHGILTCMLYFDFNGSSQGFGGYGLYVKDGLYDQTKVVANYGLEFLKRVIDVGDSYGRWEHLKDKQFYALRETPYGAIVGIMSPDRKRTFFPKELLTVTS